MNALRYNFRHNLLRHGWKLATAIPVGLLLLSGLPFLTAFEAHVVNVTARIEPRQPKCDAVSLDYWNNHEGCKNGEGESEHASEVEALSSQYGGAFEGIDGGEMCKLLVEDDCSGGSADRARCEAKKHTLVVYLNLATLRLNASALLAGADDDSKAFDHLDLSGYSTITEALLAIEAILTDPDTKKKALDDAAHVAERITAFYEHENLLAPKCVFDPDDVPKCIDHSFKIRIRNENHADVENDIDIDVNTGGNSANGGDGAAGGDGGTIETGDVTVEVNIENEVNTNETTIDIGAGCSDCAAARAPEAPAPERETRAARPGRSEEEAEAVVEIEN